MTDKPKVKEAIVVEGRDDSINLMRAVDCFTIETHGFGIRRETFEEIKKADKSTGIIIFTDPDHAGEEIRRRLTRHFPDAKQAFLLRSDALRNGDVGVENAEPEAIIDALKKCRAMFGQAEAPVFTQEELYAAGLAGGAESKKLRQEVAGILGIGYANTKGFLKKLNGFRISKEEFYEALRTVNHKGNKE